MQTLYVKSYSGCRITIFRDSAGDIWYSVTAGGYELVEGLAYSKSAAMDAAKTWIDSR